MIVGMEIDARNGDIGGCLIKTILPQYPVSQSNILKPGMILKGVVSNVANFGAFVDVGVHQDGLVHISAITNKFISDPRGVVKPGDIVKVKVVEVDAARNRISFTMRLNDEIQHTHSEQGNTAKRHQPKQVAQHVKAKKEPVNAAFGNAFADAFAKAKGKK